MKTNQIPSADDKEAALKQMRINTRLTAMQAALEVMNVPGYVGAITIDERIAMAKKFETWLLEIINEPSVPQPTLVLANSMPPPGAFKPGA